MELRADAAAFGSSLTASVGASTAWDRLTLLGRLPLHAVTPSLRLFSNVSVVSARHSFRMSYVAFDEPWMTPATFWQSPGAQLKIVQ